MTDNSQQITHTSTTPSSSDLQNSLLNSAYDPTAGRPPQLDSVLVTHPPQPTTTLTTTSTTTTTTTTTTSSVFEDPPATAPPPTPRLRFRELPGRTSTTNPDAEASKTTDGKRKATSPSIDEGAAKRLDTVAAPAIADTGKETEGVPEEHDKEDRAAVRDGKGREGEE